MPYFKCPECGLTLKRHPQLAAVDDLCPRCRADGHSPVALAVLALARRRRAGPAPDAAAADGTQPAIDHHMLTLRSEHLGRLSTLTLWGELDIGSAAVLEAEVIVADEVGAEAITLDLSGLAFIDTAGLRAVLAAQERCERRGMRMSLLRGRAQVQRIFDLTRTTPRLSFLD